MKSITVLSSACGAMFMPGFFCCLKDNGERNIRIVGVDLVEKPFLGSLIDVYYQVPSYNSEDYVSTLLEICYKEKVDIFFPHISMELPIILKRIDDFKKLGVKVAITDNETLNIANNKYQLYEYMKANGLKTPKYYRVENEEQLMVCARKLGYPQKPVVIKVSESSGSRGIRIIREDYSRAYAFLYQKPNSINITMREMCDILSEIDQIPDLFIMEYLPGCEYTVDLLAKEGKTLYIAGRRNYESSMSIAMASYIEKNEVAYKLCEDIVSMLKLDGNIGFDFLLDENGIPVLTDLNPRITATIVLYKGGGLNLPYLRIKQLLGEELPLIDVKYGIGMKRKFLEIFS